MRKTSLLAMIALATAAAGPLLAAPAATDADKKPAAAAAAAPAATPAAALDPKEQENLLYAIGVALSQNVGTFNFSPAELETVKRGFMDGSMHKDSPKVDLQAYMPKIQAFAQTRTAAAAEIEKKSSVAFLDKAAAEKGAVKLPSGVIYVETKAGTGEKPKPTDTVKVHYKGTLTDGTVFDSSIERGEPATFPLSGVIPCWTEGVQQMKVGGTAKLVCPSDKAYGDRGAPPKIKPGAALVFEVQLLAIEAPKPAAVPPTTAPVTK